MSYYFAVDTNNKCYIIVAANEESAKSFIKNLDYIYKLLPNTFNDEGILMCW